MRASTFVLLAAVSSVGFSSHSTQAAVYASGVVASQTSGLASGYDNAAAAVGAPTLVTDPGDAFQGVVTPFNPAFLPSEIVGIAAGGKLTLQFPNIVNVGGGNEVGVFSNVFLSDASYPNGQNKPVAQANGSNTTGGGKAAVFVSNDGINWQPITPAPTTFDRPANAYTDLSDPYQVNAGTHVADFGIPFTHTISDFNNANFAATLALFGNSGGGTWLNLASSGLSQIDYIQFQVPTGSALNIDAVSINNNAVGAAVPEPASLAAVGLGLVGLLARRRK